MSLKSPCFPRDPCPHYVFLRYVDSPNGRTAGNGRRFYLGEWLVSHNAKGLAEKKEAGMKETIPPADYYRRILSVQPHSLKRLDPFAAIVKCHRGQEISNDSGPAGHWYNVIVGAVGRCSTRSG